MRANLYRAALLLMAAALPAPAKAQPSGGGSVEWRLENPFRFFKRPADTALHRETYLQLTSHERQRPILAIERRLAERTSGAGWAAELHAGDKLADRVNIDSCWLSAAACRDYVHPAVHNVLVRAPNVNGPCVWRWSSGEARAAECSAETLIAAPYPGPTRVAAEANGAIVAQGDIAVRDVFIVSLGDSFASGEGNPDAAVELASSNVMNYSTTQTAWRGYPSRDGVHASGASVIWPAEDAFQRRRARWLHQSCHRSLYSNHLRAALQIAIEDDKQQTSVTFVSTACTGSEIVRGLFLPWNGNAELAPNEPVTVSQLSGVAKAMCKGPAPSRTFDFSQNGALPALRGVALRHCPHEQSRPIDLVMVSIGGNDVGFTGLVATAAVRLDRSLETLAPLFGETVKTSVVEARHRSAALPARYAALADAIKRQLHITDPGRVLLNAYPHIAHDETGKPCSGKAGMDVTPDFAINRARAVEAETFVENDLTRFMAGAAAVHGWRLVDQHRTADWFRAHGVCAYRESERADKSLSAIAFPKCPVPADSSETMIADALRRSKSLRGGGLGHGLSETASCLNKWAPFKPDAFRPYASRQRWFRTPNDAYLVSHYHDSQPLGDQIAITRFAAYSGAFHMTAEGHAAIADALREKAREVLRSDR